MASTARSAGSAPDRNAVPAFQNTDRPIANPHNVRDEAAAANHREMTAGSAPLPRMI